MEKPILINGQKGYVLIASSIGEKDADGGLFAYDGSVKRIDWLSCTGLTLAGHRLIRALWTPSMSGSTSEILIYDHQGVERYLRMDDVTDIHDLLWDGENLLVVSSSQNCIFWISLSGEVKQVWKAPGEGDAWHLNCLLLKEGQVYASAFSRFTIDRMWEHSKQPTGMLFNVGTGEDVFSNLVCPHHPRFLDGSWVICESGRQDLVAINPANKQVEKCVHLGGYTRGIAVSDDLIFVGVSADRYEVTLPSVTAHIAILSRKNWEVLGRIPLSAWEIYDLIFVPQTLVEGLCRGFRTNLKRTSEQDQLAMFLSVGIAPKRLWAVGDVLSPDDCRIHIKAQVPQFMRPGQILQIECTVNNLGKAIFVSAPPYPIHLSYRWLRSKDLVLLPMEGLRSTLFRSLVPFESLTQKIKVQAPMEEGDYCLKLTMVQEYVRWFDDVDNQNLPIYAVQVSTKEQCAVAG